MERLKLSIPDFGELSAVPEFCIDLPDLNDVQKPALRRAIERVLASNQPGEPQKHQKHGSHDRTGHVSGLW